VRSQWQPLEALRNSLFQLSADLGELAGNVDADGIDNSYDGERDGGRDQAIFNGGGAGFIG